MKSKELIEALQQLDPTGETEVSVGNHPIWYVEDLPAFYDGYLQVLIRDKSKEPYYDITGAKYVGEGRKISIHTMGVTDLLWNDPEAIVEYNGGSIRYKETDEQTRKSSKHVELRVEAEAFYRWAKTKANAIRPDEDNLKRKAYRFYLTNLSPSDPVKELSVKTYTSNGQTYQAHPSWAERREAWWDENVLVRWAGEWVIKKR